MNSLIKSFWTDESGFILSAELVLIATVGILGMTVALVAVRDSIAGEMTDLANAFQNIDQSYGYGGVLGCRTPRGHLSWTAGSSFVDESVRSSEEGVVLIGDLELTSAELPPGQKETLTVPPVPAPTREPGTPPPPVLHAPRHEDSAPPAPRLEVPCENCPPPYGFSRRTPSSDIPPPGSKRIVNSYYYPQFFMPQPPQPTGPLQVW